jgi:hypothetical protein
MNKSKIHPCEKCELWKFSWFLKYGFCIHQSTGVRNPYNLRGRSINSKRKPSWCGLRKIGTEKI